MTTLTTIGTPPCPPRYARGARGRGVYCCIVAQCSDTGHARSVTRVSSISDPVRLAAVRMTGLLDSEPEEAFDGLARVASAVLSAPFAFVHVVDDTRSYFKSCIGIDRGTLPVRGLPIEHSFCQYVIGTGAEVVIGDVMQDPMTAANPSIEELGVRAWAGFPLRSPDGEIVGTLCVVDTVPRAWSDHEVEVLRTLAQAASGEIALRAALERVAAFAADLQASLLPDALPDIPGVDVGAAFVPATDGFGLLGDFYDVFATDGHWIAVMGDVCGHGVAAAKTAAMARWTLRASAQRSHDPSQMLAELNHVLFEKQQDDTAFMTAQVVAFEPASSGSVRFRVANGGHPPPFLRRDGDVQSLHVSGRMLGVAEGPGWDATSGVLDRGEALLLYTDGVTEARMHGRFFGDAALMRVLAASTEASAHATAEAVVDAALSFAHGRARDDTAALVIAARPEGSPDDSRTRPEF